MGGIKGELKEFTSFSKAITGMKNLTVITVVSCSLVVVTVFGLYLFKLSDMNEDLDKARTEHFVIDPLSGYIMKGEFRSLSRHDRINQYKALVRRMVGCFYGFDGESFKVNLREGVNYASEDVNNIVLNNYLNSEFDLGKVLRDKKERRYVHTDSVAIDVDSKPIRGIYYGKQKRKVPYGELWKNLVFSFEVRELDKVTDKNEFGAVVDKWVMLDNKVLKKIDKRE